MSGAVHLRLVLTAALVALSVAVARPSEDRGPTLRATAAGDLQIASSAADQAILDVSGLSPGDAASGALTIANKAPGSQKLRLKTVGVVDTPGPGGGVLSSHLRLLVERTTGSTAHVVYDGPVDQLTDVDLGALPASSSHVYTFTATVPEGGPALDDPYAGASVEVGWRWEAKSDGEDEQTLVPEPSPEPAAPAKPGGAARGATAPAAAGTTGAQRAAGPDEEGPAPAAGGSVRLWLGGPRVQRAVVRRGRRGVTLEALARCRPACSVVAKAKVRIGRRWVTLPSRRVGAAHSRGPASKLSFRLSARELRRLRAAMPRGRRVSVRLVVRATAPAAAPSEHTLALSLRR